MAFKEHMMYKGEQSEKAETNQEHLKLKKMDYKQRHKLVIVIQYHIQQRQR